MTDTKYNKLVHGVWRLSQNWRSALCASVGFFAPPLPNRWLGCLAVGVLYASLWMRQRSSFWGLWAATGLFLLWTGASAPVAAPISLWLVFCAICLFLGAPQDQRRAFLGPIVALTVPCLLVILVLMRSGWFHEAKLMFGHLRGVLLAAGYLIWARPKSELCQRQRVSVGWLCLLSGLWSLNQAPDVLPATVLPAWRIASALDPSACDEKLFAQLWRLQAAGAKDTSDVLVALAMRHNTSPQVLRRLCRKQGFDAGLQPEWAKKRQLGRTACLALQTPWPEEAAAKLEDATEPELQRLRADLLWEAGDVEQAQQLQTRQVAAGLTFADQDLYMQQAQRHCVTTQHGLESAKNTPAEGFVAWTQVLRDMDWGRLADRVFQTADVPGHITMVWDPDLRQMVTATVSAFGSQFGVRLPIPEHQALPAALKLMMRAETLPRIEIHMSHGHTQIFDCQTQVPASFGALRTPVSYWPLPRSLCQQQQWTKVVLPVRYATENTQIDRITLYGTFRLGLIEAVAQRKAPIAVTPEDGEVQHKQDVL